MALWAIAHAFFFESAWAFSCTGGLTGFDAASSMAANRLGSSAVRRPAWRRPRGADMEIRCSLDVWQPGKPFTYIEPLFRPPAEGGSLILQVGIACLYKLNREVEESESVFVGLAEEAQPRKASYGTRLLCLVSHHLSCCRSQMAAAGTNAPSAKCTRPRGRSFDPSPSRGSKRRSFR